MSLGAVLFHDDVSDVAVSTARLESVRHRGLRQAFQALKPGLLVCHPDTFQIRYANAAAREILGIEQTQFPWRLPDAVTMTCQQEYVAAEKRHVACYRVEINDGCHDARAFPVYHANGTVDCVMVVIRNYNDVSWSLFEMLDRLPMAIAALTEDQGDVRYINRMALREIYSLRGQGLLKRPARKADPLIEETLLGLLRQTPGGSEGCQAVTLGRGKVDMHFARLGEAGEAARLLYWDPRVAPLTWH
jgi:hypothetical protein